MLMMNILRKKKIQRIYHQDTNKEDFKGMTLCKNLLFYTLSPVNNEDTDGILKTIIDLISNIFFASDNGKKEELFDERQLWNQSRFI